MIDTDKYEEMTWETPSDELEDAVENLLAEVKRLREVMIHVEQKQPHPALEWALKEGLTLAEIRERIE